MAERLPHGTYGTNTTIPMHLPNGVESHAIQHIGSSAEHLFINDASNVANMAPSRTGYLGQINENSGDNSSAREIYRPNETSAPPTPKIVNAKMEQNLNPQNAGQGEMWASSTRLKDIDSRTIASPQSHDDAVPAVRSPSEMSNDVEAEWIEQFEPGVYITLVTLRDGTRDLKRVRFR